ncbi:exopolyphosphatase [bacterium]|nr:exopolyphosphatase [bacterium]
MKFAAIDIGSNAVRLLCSNVFEEGGKVIFKKASFFRVPLRLGDDVFLTQRIPENKTKDLIKTLVAFKNLIEIFEPINFMACATSAMREAQNNQEIIEKIKNETGILIEIIDGESEAEFIFSNHVAESLEPDNSYLYIDVGGGSTELTLFAKQKKMESASFNIGTVRLLEKLVEEPEWEKMKQWIKNYALKHKPLVGIGSGGNINKIFKLAQIKDEKPLSIRKMIEIHDYLNSFTLEERITVLGLRPDRADVIIPALEIYREIMETAKISKIIVPQVGLVDGIICKLYDDYVKNKK